MNEINEMNAPKPTLQAIINVKLYDFQHYKDHAYIVFDEAVIEVGNMTYFSACQKKYNLENVIDAHGRLLLPGLINFHTHMYSAFARGFQFNCDSTKFTEILKQVWWRLDKSLTLEDVYESAVSHCRELLKSGVVGVIDHHAGSQIEGSTTAIEKAIQATGLHGITCFEISDRFDIEKAIHENKAMHDRTGGPIGLHASMTLSEKTLERVKQTLGNLPIHVHVSESVDDHTHYLETPTQRFKRMGLLHKPALLAHCVHIDESDASIISESQSTVVLCPLSNMNNGVGSFNYGLLKRHEIPIVIGTDGLGADVARSWQMLYYTAVSSPENSGDMTLEALRKWIVDSYHYYEKLTGLKLGKFEPGYRMDGFLTDYQWFTPLNAQTAFAHVFYGVFDRLDIDMLWIGGRVLMENHLLNGHQPSHHYMDGETDAITCAKNLWLRMGEPYDDK